MRLVPKDPVVRVSTPLAKEIGLAQSMLLLQIDFWLGVMQGKEIDGVQWVRISTTKFREAFPFMARSSIKKTLTDLWIENLIHIRSDLNRKSWDRTQWFALNEYGIDQLKSVRVSKQQKKADPAINEPTIPTDYILSEYNPNRSHETASDAPASHESRVSVKKGKKKADPDHPSYRSLSQLDLFSRKPKRRRTLGERGDKIERIHHGMMYELCYGVSDGTQAMTLNSTQRGRVADALATLRDAKAKLDDIPKFEQWWKTHWQSRNKQGGYEYPRPDQVVEHWWKAMKPFVAPEKKEQPTTESNVVDFEEVARRRALKMRG